LFGGKGINQSVRRKACRRGCHRQQSV